MRVFFVTLVTATALFAVACSGGTEDSSLQRGRSAASPRGPSGSGDGTTSSSPAPTPSPATPPADPTPTTNDAGTGTKPAPTPPAPGSCLAPKCFGVNGVGGCKATDGAGDTVTMGCQDGACACFAGGQTTSTFDGDVNSADDASQLFLLNCTCN